MYYADSIVANSISARCLQQLVSPDRKILPICARKYRSRYARWSDATRISRTSGRWHLVFKRALRISRRLSTDKKKLIQCSVKAGNHRDRGKIRTFQRRCPRLFVHRGYLGNTVRGIVVRARTPEGCVLLIFRGPPPLSRLISIRLIGQQWSLVDRLFTRQYRGRWLHGDKHPRGLRLMRLVYSCDWAAFSHGVLRKIEEAWSLLSIAVTSDRDLFIWAILMCTWHCRTHV